MERPCDLRLDLGCGPKKVPGSIGVDIAPAASVGVLADFNYGLPFRDTCADAVYAYHLLEHVDDFLGFMEEIWRVCRPGAHVYIKVPHGSSTFVTWKDPTHKRGLFIATFAYFDDTYFDGKVFAYYSKANFRIERARLNFNIHNGSLLFRILNQLVNAFGNGSRDAQFYCERFWGPMIGIEEAALILRAVK